MKKYSISLIVALFVLVGCSGKTPTDAKRTITIDTSIKDINTPPKHGNVLSSEFIPRHIRLSHIEVVPHY